MIKQQRRILKYKKRKKVEIFFKKHLQSGNLCGMITNCMRLFTKAPSQAEVTL